jgi:hypothetical protein
MSGATVADAPVRSRPRLPGLERAREASLTGWPLTVAALGLLLLIAVLLRTRGWSSPYWIDEGISVGIGSYPLSEIPGVLRLDGSPPLYYMLLHVWMDAFGEHERATHALSAVFAVLSVPAGYWAARTFGRNAALVCALIMALNPYVTQYAVETRMYSLVLLLTLLTTGAFLRAFVQERRPYAFVFAVMMAALLYTHNWGLFYGLAAGAAFLYLLWESEDRRRLLLTGAIGFGLAALLFLPWLPTLIDQAQHTGAPWSKKPTKNSFESALSRIFSGQMAATALMLIGGAGMVRIWRSEGGQHKRAIVVLLVIGLGTLVIAWVSSRIEPAWASRYFFIVLAPIAVVVAGGLSRMKGLAIAAIVLAAVVAWPGRPKVKTLQRKSNVASLADKLKPHFKRDMLVFSSQPEQVPNAAFYFPTEQFGLRYMTPLGHVTDTRVFDWRDALPRLRRARYTAVLQPVVKRMKPGEDLMMLQPKLGDPQAPWTRNVRRISRRWRRAVRRDGLVTVVQIEPDRRQNRSNVIAVVFRKPRPKPNPQPPGA